MRRIRSLFVPLFMMLWSACSASNSSSNANTDGSVDSTIVFLDAGPATPDAPDGGASCPTGCNYQTQEGCDSGQMCYPQLTGGGVTPQCQKAGAKAAGESCVWAECQAGLFCAADGHCRHMCCAGDWSVCATNESCTQAIQLASDGGSPVPAGVDLCEPVDACDVLDPESCPAGKTCYIVDSRGDVRCLATGTVQFNGICSATNLCAAGLTCVQSSDGRSGTCRRLCRAVVGGAEPGCPLSEGGYCAHFVRDPAGVGECTPSM